VNHDDLLKSGDYARKQIFCRSRVVAWSHGSRFDLARRLATPTAGGRLLDYGCGDGTFLAMVPEAFSESAGVDVDPAQIAECAARLGQLRGVSFGLTRDLANAPSGAWDVVTCMEVLEHCLETERRRVVGELARLVRPTGRVVVSVPIEVGPSVAGKQFFRALAGLRRLGDYAHRERYSAGEMLRSIAGRGVGRVVFEGEGAAGPYHYHGHKGFDFRVLARELAERFTIERRLFTPLPITGPLLNSQAWFVCAPLRAQAVNSKR
jgi:2-polyprenyl-3-methyl-5-hydroxy-6-metoxy-1,4-benzoquinol methylase